MREADTVIEREPTALMRVMEENLAGHVSFLQRQLDGMTVEEDDGLMIVDSGLWSDTFNKILRARLEPEVADERIDDALSHFRSNGRPFSFWLGPCARPFDLPKRLEKRGLRASERELGMAIELARLPETGAPEGADVRRVQTERELLDFASVLSDLGEPPDPDVLTFFTRAAPIVLEAECPMRFYVAYVSGEPAATSELYVGGGAAGVHMVATSPRFRRRGLGMALTWTALAEGLSLGETVGTLQATAQGRPVYERLGFEPCGSLLEMTPVSFA